MTLPGYTADISLYQTTNRYVGGMAGPVSDLAVSPALPGCASCNWAFDKCFDCLDKGGKFKNCPACRVISHCAGACDSRPSGNPDTQNDWLNQAQCQSACGGDPVCVETFC
jgi:hypothetical protein